MRHYAYEDVVTRVRRRGGRTRVFIALSEALLLVFVALGVGNTVVCSKGGGVFSREGRALLVREDAQKYATHSYRLREQEITKKSKHDHLYIQKKIIEIRQK